MLSTYESDSSRVVVDREKNRFTVVSECNGYKCEVEPVKKQQVLNVLSV